MFIHRRRRLKMLCRCKRLSFLLFTIAVAVYSALPVVGAPLFSASQNAVQQTKVPTANIAASVDGYTISMDQVRDLAVRQDGPNITTQLIDDYLLEQAAKERHIVVTQKEIDDRVQFLTKAIAPMTLEQGLKAHHTTIAELQNDIRHWYLRIKLAAPYVAPTKYVHVRVILILVQNGQTSPSNNHTYLDALAIVKQILGQLKGGGNFEELAAKYNEDPSTKNSNDDAGVLYTGCPYDTPLVDSALALKAGEISQSPIKSNLGYYVIQAISTGEQHPESENQLYADAKAQYTLRQEDMHGADVINTLKANAHIMDNLPE